MTEFTEKTLHYPNALQNTLETNKIVIVTIGWGYSIYEWKGYPTTPPSVQDPTTIQGPVLYNRGNFTILSGFGAHAMVFVAYDPNQTSLNSNLTQVPTPFGFFNSYGGTGITWVGNDFIPAFEHSWLGTNVVVITIGK